MRALGGSLNHMAVYLVTWDLNKEKPNYGEARKQFIAQLDRHDNTTGFWTGFSSFYSTGPSAIQLATDLPKVKQQ
jgi:hypothetical protein